MSDGPLELSESWPVAMTVADVALFALLPVLGAAAAGAGALGVARAARIGTLLGLAGAPIFYGLATHGRQLGAPTAYQLGLEP